MATPKTTLNIHPKLFASTMTSLAISVLGFIALGVDPAIFAPLGDYAAPVAMIVSLAAGGLVGWLKKSEKTSATETTTVTEPPVVAAPTEPVAEAPVPAVAEAKTFEEALSTSQAPVAVKKSPVRHTTRKVVKPSA